MLIKWSQHAENEFLDILRWYKEQGGKELAEAIAQQIWTATQRLQSFPHSAPSGVIPGTRELTFPHLPYIIVYEVQEVVFILRIIHTSRIWPR